MSLLSSRLGERRSHCAFLLVSCVLLSASQPSVFKRFCVRSQAIQRICSSMSATPPEPSPFWGKYTTLQMSSPQQKSILVPSWPFLHKISHHFFNEMPLSSSSAGISIFGLQRTPRAPLKLRVPSLRSILPPL